MTFKKKLLIVSQTQFGYHIDTYEYAKNLRQQYDITFVCWDYELPRVSVDGVDVVYSSRDGSKIKRNLRFRYELLKLMTKTFDYVFIMYFAGASLIHLFRRNSVTICDVRTGSVARWTLARCLSDTLLRLEISTFRNRTIISDNLSRRLGIRSCHLLPLGANLVPFSQKDFKKLHLVYVGGFHRRRIEDTVKGFYAFYRKYKDYLECSYTIIGSGRGNEKEVIEEAIAEYQLEGIVKLTGYIQHDQLTRYLQEGNIGIAYVPITKFFDCQPATKTFEYLLSGMAVLATSTRENCLVINESNGVLIKDNADGVFEGLERLYKNRTAYDPRSIQEDAMPYSWDNIIQNNLNQYLTQLDRDSTEDDTKSRSSRINSGALT